MNERQLNKIRAAIERGYKFLAGDPVQLHHATGTGGACTVWSIHDLVAIYYDIDMERVGGLAVDEAGLRDITVRELLVLKSDIPGIEIGPADWFEIEGEHWDLFKKYPIQSKVAPLGGLQNIFSVWVRRNTELTHTDADARWGFDETGS
jgi:hypothetical protein